jgi:hypothetical protein
MPFDMRAGRCCIAIPNPGTGGRDVMRTLLRIGRRQIAAVDIAATNFDDPEYFPETALVWLSGHSRPFEFSNTECEALRAFFANPLAFPAKEAGPFWIIDLTSAPEAASK